VTDEFAARRRAQQDGAISDLLTPVKAWIAAIDDPAARAAVEEALTELYVDTYVSEGGRRRAATKRFLASLKRRAALTTADSSPEVAATWLAVATINAAALQAATDSQSPALLKWTTMHDSSVRDAHRVADRQRRPAGALFHVGGENLLYPGDPRGRPDNTLNCRCVLQVVPVNQSASFGQHELLFLENRRTPKVVSKGARYKPKPSEGRITRRRPATAEEEKTIARGDWVRVNERGDKPGDKRYMDKKSKVRPHQNSLQEDSMPLDTPLPWHAVLAPEDEWSGDGRRFAAGSLRNRDLPLPLTWQKASSDGHNTSVVIGRIDKIERVDNMMRGEGVFVDTPETDEFVGLLAEFGRFGISVDADDSEFEFDEGTGKVTFNSARISSACCVSIPAFSSAFIAFGTWAEADAPTDQTDQPADTECDPESPDYEDCIAQKEAKDSEDDMAPSTAEHASYSIGTSNSGVVELISDTAWDGSAGRFTPEQWKRSCVLHVCDGMEKSCHKLPIKEPGGALSRAGVHAAAARFNQVDAPPEAKASAARQLRGAYKQLGEEPPDVIKAAGDTDEFGRGPGWVTDPVATRRIWAYWTQPGHEGYAKINWGVPGDFNRCRTLVGEKITENSPEDLKFINQICSQWHHDATGFWPGRAPTERLAAEGDPVSVSLVASAGITAPAAWFDNPMLSGPTHLTVTDEGRVFGHIAEWRTCHVGYDGVCVAPPASLSDYAYFATGRVALDNGQQASTGVISLGGGHAGPNMSFRAAVAHYDSTSTAVADVSVGEDEFGIWCAGWIRPGVNDEAVYALRASDVSGDWREIGGSMEMIAALAVNVAGFPVAAVRNRAQVALVAAGVVQAPQDEVAELVKAAVSAHFDRLARMQKLKTRVGVN
jgi:hypothetical protein